MKKYRLLALVLIAVLVVIFAFLYVICNRNSLRFSKKWIIGKSAGEIVEKYGEFDVIRTNEEYGTMVCGYVIREKKIGYLGTTPEQYFLIRFDEKGLAYECYEESGGIGG